ncbi:MAG: NusG domain II-containing protein [Lachnospiraceae bacterium]|nr:NusG domain II-containing protein [Lachnospiraceae bacterium]
MKKKSISKDLVLVGGLLLAGLVLGLVLLLGKKTGKTVEIRVTGAPTRRISLEDSGRYEIQGLQGTNLLVIENGKAHMEEASCPDGVCKGMGEIDSEGQSIICLPNEIVVVVADEKSETDTQKIDVIAGGKG